MDLLSYAFRSSYFAPFTGMTTHSGALAPYSSHFTSKLSYSSAGQLVNFLVDFVHKVVHDPQQRSFANDLQSLRCAGKTTKVDHTEMVE